MQDAVQVNSAILESQRRQFPNDAKERTMSRMFFAVMVGGLSFCAAAAVADSQSTKDLI
jgi:hypothetical protein